MGFMSEMAIEVEEMLFDGATHQEIAKRFNISLEQVEAFIEELESADRDPYEWDDVDADADALASAGFGTDEDYGYACDDY